jgi:hypothetical protein
LASTERKSTYPPEAESDQDVQPDGTGMDMLTKPGNPLPGPTYKFHAADEPQAFKTAVPAPLLWVNATITSK